MQSVGKLLLALSIINLLSRCCEHCLLNVLAACVAVYANRITYHRKLSLLQPFLAVFGKIALLPKASAA